MTTSKSILSRSICLSLALASCVSVHAGLVAWWKFDDTVGSTTAADSSGNPSPATATVINGGVFQPANGRFGGALYLDGVNDYAEVPDRADMKFAVGQSFSIAAWYKSDGDETSLPGEYAGGLNQGIVTKAYPGTAFSNNYFQVQITVPAAGATGTPATQSYFVFDSRLNNTAGTNLPFRKPGAFSVDVVNNAWHHVVAVMDRGTGTFKMYVDNVLVNTSATTAADGGGQWAMGSTAPLVIGNHQNRYCRGWFDDIGIWNHALSASDVSSIFTNGISLGSDTDNDGLVDSWETTYWANITIENGAGNPDADGLTNLQEQTRGTNPTLADTDGDGLTDGAEVNTYLTNPLVADTDGDGLNDGVEVNTHGTNPLRVDTDGDNWNDGEEITAGTNPLLAASTPIAAVYNVHINEFMANSSPKANDPTAPLDMDGDSEDWIEIRNNEATSVNLKGYHLSDNLALPAKYTLPNLTIAAGGYALVYASGKDRHVNGAQPHTNFQLSTTGQLVLSRPSVGGPVAVSQIGTLLVPYPSQHRYVTYGAPDNLAATAPAYLTTPTPGAANNPASVTGFVADTTFSVDRGIYAAAFATTLACPTPGATIVYTFNGSTPTLTNGTQIPPADSLTPPSGAVNITATTLVRARAFKTGFAPSDTDTQSYIFAADVMTQNSPPASIGVGTTPGSLANTINGWGTINGTAGTGTGAGATPAVLTGLTGVSAGLSIWGVNQAMATDPIPDNQFRLNDLMVLPTLSLVANWKDLFGPNAGEGIYPPASGVAQEGVDRAASLELINPTASPAAPNLAKGFQTDGNIHIFGGTSQARWKSLKLSFRFQCLNDVNFRAYGDQATNQFKNFVLDSAMNNTWMHPTDAAQRARSAFTRDYVMADLQNKMSGAGGFHTRACHLYLNGMYWGIYWLHEKPDHHYGSAYFGGNSGDYDAFKHSATAGVDGAANAYPQIVNSTYLDPALPLGSSSITALNSSSQYYNCTVLKNYEDLLDLVGSGFSAPNPAPDLTQPANYNAVAAVLDIDHFIDYMMLNFVGGNQDWADKNLYCMKSRAPGGKWRFASWDAEHVFRTGTENFIAGGGNEVPRVGQPKDIHNKLRVNAEYKLRWADRIRKQMFNGGPLTVAGMTSAFNIRDNEITDAIRGESARWGYARASVNGNISYKRSDWLAEVNRITLLEAGGNSLIQNRWNLYMAPTTGQFRLATYGLYPTTEAPDFSQHGGSVPANYELTISNPNASGTIYYTLDGADPRVVGGAVSGTAQTYTAPVILASSGTVKSRILLSGVWSALNEAYFSVGTVPATTANIVVSEFSYNPSLIPATPGYNDPNDFEYIELLNISANTVDFTDCEFKAGVTFHFNNASIRQLAPGARLIIAENAAALTARHGPGLPIAGEFELNTGLSNGGERITLTAADGTTAIRTFEYKDSGAWPIAADGGGFSLVLIAPFSSPNHDQAENWRTSALGNNGTPGGNDNTAAYATWKTTNSIAADGGDEDGDGYKNILEYILGTNPNAPTTPATSAAIAPLTVNAIPGTYFTFTFTHAPATDDVTWRVEMSPDLTTWSAAPADTQRVSMVVNVDGSITETWRSGAPVTGVKHFARIYSSTP